MKFVIFLVTCVAAYEVDECGCRKNNFFAKVVDWCGNHVNFVADVKDIKEDEIKEDSEGNQYYTGIIADFVHRKPDDLPDGRIKIRMLRSNCSFDLTTSRTAKRLLGGTFKGDILTITKCNYKTWSFLSNKVFDVKKKEEEEALCERYRKDVAERERQIARIFDLVEKGSPTCKYCPVVFNQDNLTDWCLADFDGKISWNYEHRTQITHIVSVTVTKVFEKSTALKVGDKIKAYISDFAACRSKILGPDEAIVRGIVHRAEAPLRIVLYVVACATSEDKLNNQVEKLEGRCEELGIPPKNTESESTGEGGPANFNWSYYKLYEFCENDFVGEMSVVKNSGQDFSVEIRRTFRISTSFADLASNPLTVRFSNLGCKELMTKTLGKLFLVDGVIHPKENVLKVVDCGQLTPELEERAKDWSAQCETEFKDLTIA